MIVIEFGFYAAAVVAMTGLCTLAIDTVPRIVGTAAFIVTLAALGLAILH